MTQTLNELLEKRKKLKCSPGIYFLFDEDEVVYVGQGMFPENRIKSHLSSEKIFDSYFVIRCDKKDLNQLEAKYILKYCPKYNQVITHLNTSVAPLGRIFPKTKNKTLTIPGIIIGNKLYVDLSEFEFKIIKKELS